MKKIVVNDGEQVLITNSKNDEKSSIVITNNGGNLVTTSGEKIIVEREKIDPLAIYDQWLDVFKQNFDAFKALVSTQKYRAKNIGAYVSTGRYASTKSDDKGIVIFLDVVDNRTHAELINGAELSISNKDKEVQYYILANIIKYYIEECYASTADIDLQDYKGIFYASGFLGPAGILTKADISGIEDERLHNIIRKLILNHNLGLPNRLLIEELRESIVSKGINKQKLSNQLEEAKGKLQYALSLNPQR